MSVFQVPCCDFIFISQPGAVVPGLYYLRSDVPREGGCYVHNRTTSLVSYFCCSVMRPAVMWQMTKVCFWGDHRVQVSYWETRTRLNVSLLFSDRRATGIAAHGNPWNSYMLSELVVTGLLEMTAYLFSFHLLMPAWWAPIQTHTIRTCISTVSDSPTVSSWISVLFCLLPPCLCLLLLVFIRNRSISFSFTLCSELVRQKQMHKVPLFELQVCLSPYLSLPNLRLSFQSVLAAWL